MKLTEKFFKRKNNDKQLQKLLRQIQAIFQGKLDQEPDLLDYESSRQLLSKAASKASPSGAIRSSKLTESVSPRNQTSRVMASSALAGHSQPTRMGTMTSRNQTSAKLHTQQTFFERQSSVTFVPAVPQEKTEKPTPSVEDIKSLLKNNIARMMEQKHAERMSRAAQLSPIYNSMEIPTARDRL